MPARPKLTPAQWDQVLERSLTEPVSKLAREFSVSESAVRKKVKAAHLDGADKVRIRNLAKRIAQDREDLEQLPKRLQRATLNLADKLELISNNMADAAVHGSNTARKMAEMADGLVDKIDGEHPMDSREHLQEISALTRIANDAANIPSLLMRIAPSTDGGKSRDPITDTERAARLAAILHEAGARRDREALVSAADGGAGTG